MVDHSLHTHTHTHTHTKYTLIPHPPLFQLFLKVERGHLYPIVIALEVRGSAEIIQLTV